MTKGIGTPENRELAFEVFRLFDGRNVERILGRLKWDYGIDISEKTLYEWKTAGKWQERLNGRDGVLTLREKLLKSVLALIEKHERQFQKEGALADSQATYAYTNLVRTAIELSGKMTRWETLRPPVPRAHAEEGRAAPPLAERITDESGHMTTIEDGAFFQNHGSGR